MHRDARRATFGALPACASLAIAVPVIAENATLAHAKDNTLYESVGGTLSNGAGEFLFSGRVGSTTSFLNRRALMAFNVAGAMPAGSTCTSATLRRKASRSSSAPHNRQRWHADWGAGTSTTDRRFYRFGVRLPP